MFFDNDTPTITDEDLEVVIWLVEEKEEATAAWLAGEEADRADLDAMLKEEMEAQQDLRWATKG